MNLNNTWITGSLDGQTMRAYLTQPAASGDTPLPTVLVIQEVWGVDEHIQDMANRFAMAGYQAIAPDLYSLGETPEALSLPRIGAVKRFLDTVPPQAWVDPKVRDQHIDKLPPDEAKTVRETLGILFSPRDNQRLVDQLKVWCDYALQHGRDVVSIGYCMGGQLSFLLATQEPRLKAAVCNYGTAPQESNMANIQAPVYGFYGGTDHRITDEVPKVAESMKKQGKTYHYKIYDEAGHAFFNDSRASYDVNAARDAWARTLAFFNDVLQG